ncbi:MAG: sulfite oxidase-like oxidoreductase [Alphaproteobacteria bacterium]|nr:sulfite oxidase-like oxidoreductase [Alphaproteobacteria bacterium]MBO6628946.1 sulfite oxidase-like oxidoreductase [Alphaproteobacteria bacterium]
MSDESKDQGEPSSFSSSFLGQIKDKLILSKEKTAAQGRHLTGMPDAARLDRLPPGQHRVDKWPVLDLGVQPDVPKAQWRLTVDGAVENPVQWDWETFMAQPQESFVSDIHCVTTWSRYDNRWEGVAASHVLDLVKPLPSAKHLIFHAYDGYTTNVKLDVFREANVLLAHSWEGAPLSREHGAPVRVIIPRWYFWKSAKWIQRIEVSEVDKPGFWEVRGYNNEGDPWNEDRYS